MIEKQTAMIIRDEFKTFYFYHNFTTGEQHAKNQFDKLRAEGNYKSLQLFNLNNSPFGDKWNLIETTKI